MARKFVVATDPLNADQEKSFIEKFKVYSGLGWWHWLPNFWLVIDVTNNLDASTLNSFVREISGAKARCIVFEVKGHTDWAAQTRTNDAGQDMARWIKDEWLKH